MNRREVVTPCRIGRLFPHRRMGLRGCWHGQTVRKTSETREHSSSPKPTFTDRANGKDRATGNLLNGPPLLLDIHQLAESLNVGRTTIEKWTKTRRIPSLKLGRVLRYDLKKVMAALEAYERKAV